MNEQFDTLADVDRYVAKHGKAALRLLIADEVMHPANLDVVLRWLAVRGQIDADAEAEEALDLQRRNTAASERSADSAARSARAAWAAAFIALGALAIAAWPFIKERL
ncbi:hypothetical protein WKW77_19950 [Variovorax ureilyticus]|uniref:Uncharacterized protein n=1 Tax=Variovorax ureilyticus TaxID=1836198 RepID=A0ABU8VIS6_9BURK